jgi:hypothetical protein
MHRVGLAVLLACAGPAPWVVAQEPVPEKAPPVEASEAAPERPGDRFGFVFGPAIAPGETVQDTLCFFCGIVVHGDAVAVGGAIRVSPGGSIGGEAVALGGPVEAPPGRLAEDPAVILGLHFPGQRQVFAIPAAIFLAAHLLLALGASLFLGERRLLHLGAVWRWSPGRTLLVGLVVVALCITIISMAGVIAVGLESAITIGIGIVLVGALALGLPVMALGVGRRLRPGLGWRSAVLAGTLVIALASLVPLAGVVVSTFLWCAVCGLAVRAFTLRKVVATSQGANPSADVLRYYALGFEKGRLDEDYFPLERARTQELILRHLPPAPGVVLDVGGAAGAYAFWLAGSPSAVTRST